MMRSQARLIVFVVLLACAGLVAAPVAAQTWRDFLTDRTAEEEPADEEQQVQGDTPEPVDPVTAGFALKELLLVAAESATEKASQVDGFAGNPAIRVPLPGALGSATGTLRRFGLEREVDELTMALNRTAEAASAGAFPVLRDAVRDLQLDEAQALVAGDAHPATDFLRLQARADLVDDLRSLVAAAAEEAGVMRAFDELRSSGGGLVDQAEVGSADLVPHVTEHTVDGLLTLMADEERAIRTDPVARTTPLLAEVFGSASAPSEAADARSETADDQASGDDTHAALRDALILGARRAVERASEEDGFLGNPDIRIPLPKGVASIGETLRDIGLNDVVDEFQTSLNRAAEKAAAEAAPILVDAVKDVTFADAVAILQGGDTAATEMLRDKTEGQLAEAFRPIIAEKMEQTGVTRAYERMMSEGGALVALFGGGAETDLPTYVTEETLDGLFTLLGEEEAKIRKNPAARTTDLLRRIFGAFGG